MSEATTEIIIPITAETEAEVVPIKKAKLLKLRHDIELLRQELLAASQKASKEAEEFNKDCQTANILIGELNDNIKSEGRDD